jgi:hypothetical protein
MGVGGEGTVKGLSLFAKSTRDLYMMKLYG